MNINILRYSLFGIAGGQEVDHNFCYAKNNFALTNLKPPNRNK